MNSHMHMFDEKECLHELRHFLPAQAPLKDFIHHNTLHGFQGESFFKGIEQASEMFGYKVLLSIDEYRELYRQKRILPEMLKRVVTEEVGAELSQQWIGSLLNDKFEPPMQPRAGLLRNVWKQETGIELDDRVHPVLFRLLCSYLDQGIAMWDFPVGQGGLLDSLRTLEKNGFISFFRGKRAHELLFDTSKGLKDLLQILVGAKESLYAQYLFDQQFAHQGWSGMVCAVEDTPSSLLKQKSISLRDFIHIELLLEIDALDARFKGKWKPLAEIIHNPVPDLFSKRQQPSHLFRVLSLWQKAFEWSYYDQVLSGLQEQGLQMTQPEMASFQAMFCIDDRECSLRRHIEHFDHACQTFGTPGFFNVEFYFQPSGGKFYTKLCPAPVNPAFLIKEAGGQAKLKTDLKVSKDSHSLTKGLLMTQTVGFWSAVRLFLGIFRPTMSSATTASFSHMKPDAVLTIENTGSGDSENGLQIGFKVEEMAIRVESLLRSIGLVGDFAAMVYIIGHGSSSTNNPHYAAYDCGACSGRPGSVNARVAAYMANHLGVREILRSRGIDIPSNVQFLGGLHDTSRDEFMFYDEDGLTTENARYHEGNKQVFLQALDLNAKERSRRLELVNSKLAPAVVHEKMKLRSVSLFEPRPELNHATNALCVVGRRELTKHLFLDRRSFLNSYDYRVDPDGTYLFGILKAAAPVCGGINLEYFFSRTDNEKLGAGSKLPHNVMGLFGVANGYDGDLRPGLPKQMIEVHDPVRLLIIVEHFQEVVLKAIQMNAATYEWFANDWVHLVCLEPDTGELQRFHEGKFVPYTLLTGHVETRTDAMQILETEDGSIPVYAIPLNS